VYFDRPGKTNTSRTLKAAAERGRALGLDEIVLATTSGETARKALELCEGFKLTAVTYHCGFKAPFESVLPEDVRRELTGRGVQVVTATHMPCRGSSADFPRSMPASTRCCWWPTPSSSSGRAPRWRWRWP
jgi:hypothetical protein